MLESANPGGHAASIRAAERQQR